MIYGGTHCIIIDAESRDQVLQSGTGWSGQSEIGRVEVWNDETFSDGLSASHDLEGSLAFFSAVREHHRFVNPTFEITPAFLWYWDAFPSNGGWSYFDSAGRSVELIRIAISMDEWKVEVSALEMRTFLAASGRELLVQKDYTLLTTNKIAPFRRVEDKHRTPWSHFDWFAMEDERSSETTAFSNVMGKYIVTGTVTARVRRVDTRKEDKNYIEYIHAIDPRTGNMSLHTCNPDMLGDYGDSSRMHWMTPVYFSREVLNRYTSEPHRYKVTAGHIWCLDLWGLDISTNTAGLVEVYLGELGRLPEGEQVHWRAYNVPPEGEMDEGRFRRDFLNQSIGSPDPAGDLRRARRRAAEVTTALLGSPVWRDLDPQAATEFEALVGPANNDPAALTAPTITLTKSLVDGIDPAPLKKYLGGNEPGEKSIALLRRLLLSLGDTQDSAEVFAALQAFRSAGGVAHLGGSKANAARVRLGIEGMSPSDAFAHMTVALTKALNRVADLVEENAATSAAESTRRPRLSLTLPKVLTLFAKARTQTVYGQAAPTLARELRT
ncbi:hypothetical protein [Brevibacterium sp.]|uniref:hypothetical protein n=1 Tax=Brevibacterium sp. TaxID=1701 RepID=UPI0025C0E16D|nr:hypothetical protein [Brevibacterium sp.]